MQAANSKKADPGNVKKAVCFLFFTGLITPNQINL
jgi:hypothetical protein